MYGYIYVLMGVFEAMPLVKERLTFCVDCAIPFITAASNCGRTDVRCPFGCRDVHRRNQSYKRSQAYYRTKEGKMKKAIQNKKRKKLGKSAKAQKKTKRKDEDFEKYLQMVTGLVEQRKVTRTEIRERIKKIRHELRQHPLFKKKKLWKIRGPD